MKKIFEDPILECVRITSEAVANDVDAPGGDYGSVPDPFG